MDLPHFERATRRAFLRQGLAATGALTAAAVALAACSKSDADTFSAPASDDTVTPAAATATTTAAVATPTSTSTSTTEPGTAPVADSGGAVEVSFSYTAADSSARVRNPYVAVWAEDADGDLVALIGVWYSTRDAKYLRELTDFTAASTDVAADQVDAVSGATRAAGRYQLEWDGVGLDGAALTGPHTLWVEAAREHGPHSVASGAISLPATGSTTIAGSGEISDVAVTVA